jgi:hypothetical protein
MSEMYGDLLAIWIKAFGLMELTDSGVDTGIPRVTPDVLGELHRGEAEVGCIFPAK